MLVYRVPLAAYLEKAPFFLAPEATAKDSAGQDLFIVPTRRKNKAVHRGVQAWQVKLGEMILLFPKGKETKPPVFISSAISGGTLKDYLERQLTLYNSQLWLVIRPSCHIFPLPCQDGQGEKLEQSALQQLLTAHPSFYSGDFCCRYLTDFRGDCARLSLYDTPETVQQKIELAASLGVGQTVILPF